MPCITTCCCCFTTYQGSIIIGVLTLLPAVASIGILSHLINVWDTVSGDVNTWAQNLTASLDTSSSTISGISDFVTSTSADMHTTCIVLLIYFVGSALTSLLLISGTYQSMRCLILPWLTMVLLRQLAFVIGIGMFFYIASGIPDTKMKNHLISYGVAEIPEIVLLSYGWLCVFSHYHHLQQIEEQVAPIGEEEPVEVLPPVNELKY